MRHSVRNLVGLLIAISAAVPALAQTVKYVDASASSGGNGNGWATAYNDLQSALAYAVLNRFTDIWVADGTYKPTTGTDRTISFVVPADTKL